MIIEPTVQLRGRQPRAPALEEGLSESGKLPGCVCCLLFVVVVVVVVVDVGITACTNLCVF